METMKITKELKDLIEKNQIQLKTGIRNHQRLLAILESDPENTDVQKQLQTEQEHIIVIGLEQKVILDKLRKEYKVFRKQTKINGTKNSIDDKRFNLTIALHRAKKQTIIQRSNPNTAPTISSSSVPPPSHLTSAPYPSTRQRQSAQSPPTPPEHLDSSDGPPTANAHIGGIASTNSSPEPPPIFPAAGPDDEDSHAKRPLLPQDMGQLEFLQYLQLATHEAFKEMQSKRVERKRRSTANPQFLYTRGWDISKRKRNFYLSNLTASPPATRQSVRSKVAKLAGERISPPAASALPNAHSTSGSASPTEVGAAMGVTLPGITHLPSGLTIEPVRDEQTACVECKQPGNLSICDECSHAFHISCHNRPLVATPRLCPICYTDAKEARLRQQMAQQGGSPITIVPPSSSASTSQQLLIEGNPAQYIQFHPQPEKLEYIQLKGVQPEQLMTDTDCNGSSSNMFGGDIMSRSNDLGPMMNMTTDGVMMFEQLIGDGMGNCGGGIDMIPVYDI